MAANDESMGHLLAGVADAIGEQAELTVALAKAELYRDARSSWLTVAPIALGVPVLALGVIFANGAGALALSTAVGVPGGFGIIALVNLALGGILVHRGTARMHDAR